MKKRLRIASVLLYVVCASSVAIGAVYCFSPTIMPYHERFLGTTHEQLPPAVAALFLFMMRGAGAAFIALGLGVAMLVKGPFGKGDDRRRQAIGILTLIPLGSLLFITLSIGLYTPWWGVAVMIALVVTSLVLSHGSASVEKSESSRSVYTEPH